MSENLADKPLQPGDRAPDVVLDAITRQGTVALSDYRGAKPVLIGLFRGLHCAFCRRHITAMAQLDAALREKGVESLTVVNTPIERARLYFRYHPLPNLLAASDPARVSPANVVRWRGEDPDLDAAARDYEEALRAGASAPWLDLALLGLGPDGHTASLFPGTSALAEEERLAVAVDVAEMGTRRLTLTYPALCGAREVCFLVTGHEKATALATVVESGHLPAARIVRRPGPVTIFCDRDAASALTTGFLKR